MLHAAHHPRRRATRKAAHTNIHGPQRNQQFAIGTGAQRAVFHRKRQQPVAQQQREVLFHRQPSRLRGADCIPDVNGLVVGVLAHSVFVGVGFVNRAREGVVQSMHRVDVARTPLPAVAVAAVLHDCLLQQFGECALERRHLPGRDFHP